MYEMWLDILIKYLVYLSENPVKVGFDFTTVVQPCFVIVNEFRITSYIAKFTIAKNTGKCSTVGPYSYFV